MRQTRQGNALELVESRIVAFQATVVEAARFAPVLFYYYLELLEIRALGVSVISKLLDAIHDKGIERVLPFDINLAPRTL